MPTSQLFRRHGALAPSVPFLDRALDSLHVFKRNPWLAWPLILGNLCAVWYGWTDYYAAQFAATPWYLWPLVSDSPNAVLLFALSLLLYQVRGKRSGILDLFAFIANVKVGLWTVFVLLYYYDGFFAQNPALQWLLFWLHIGMVGQAFVLHRDLVRTKVPHFHYLAAIMVFFAHDVIDYGFGTHPYLPREPSRLVLEITVILTGVAAATAGLLYRRSLRRSQETATGEFA